MYGANDDKRWVTAACLAGVILFIALDVYAVMRYLGGQDAADLTAALPALHATGHTRPSGPGADLQTELVQPPTSRSSTPSPAVEMPSDPGSFTTAREFLEDWWGERWPQVLADSGVGEGFLDRFPLSELKPWEEARSAVIAHSMDHVKRMGAMRSHMLCRDKRGYVDLEGGLMHLSEGGRVFSDTSAIQENLQRHKSLLKTCGATYWSAVSDAVRDAWSLERVDQQPILPSFEPVQANALYQHSGAMHGWCYLIVLLSEDYPHVAQAQAAMDAAQQACLDDLLAALR